MSKKFFTDRAAMNAVSDGGRSVQQTISDVTDTSAAFTGSFSYGLRGTGLTSTQQLNVDWSEFDRHTFFCSAVDKVNVGFDQVINGYPFDGSRAEVEAFLNRLTGYERWLFGQFPRYRGALHFSGSAVGEDTDGTSGTYVTVTDAVGGAFPDLTRKNTGDAVLDPGESSFSIECQLLLPQEPNDVQVICQKTSGSQHGFSLYLSQSLSPTTVDASFAVSSGSSCSIVTCALSKGRFNHVCAVFDRSLALPLTRIYVNEQLAQEASSRFEVGSLAMPGSQFTLGTGSAHAVGSVVVTPKQTLSGVMDELRVFHSVRTQAQQRQYAAKSLFQTDDLRLYFRFNEPPPPLSSDGSVDSIVLDSSGNALHAYVNNFTGSLRVDADADPFNPLVHEKQEFTPILFPAHSGVIALNSNLLLSASSYDAVNPNIITRLVPPHYLLDGNFHDGLEPAAQQSYSGDSIPGSGQLTSPQYMLTFLYIWARFFDELKLFIDAFSTLRTVGYETNETVPDAFLDDVLLQRGFRLPPLFSDATIGQFFDAENIDPQISTSATSLRDVRNSLLRRVLTVLPDIVRSKGTLHSIESFLRSIGIDPKSSMRIREYGGPTAHQLSHARENRRSIVTMLPFTSASCLSSPPLSGSRLEVGFPTPRGTLVSADAFPPHGISNDPCDGLLTSGSWTIETAVMWPRTQTEIATTQSILRIMTQGSGVANGVVANVIATSDTQSGIQHLKAYFRPGTDAVTSPILLLDVTASVLDRNRWQLSFGCARNDDNGAGVDTITSSSYFLRAARMENGAVAESHATSSFFLESASGETNSLRFISGSSPAETAPYIQVGNNPHIGTGSGMHFLNNDDLYGGSNEGAFSSFDGMLADVRVWSKFVDETEWKEHVRNPRSFGVNDPTTNFNFNRTSSGSFGRLRVDSVGKRYVVDASGGVTFYDTSLNGFHMTGSGFSTERTVIPTILDHSILSPNFDESCTSEKIRIRSLANPGDDDVVAGVAPIHEIQKNEEPTDDTRFAIEFSLVDALNSDIVCMFSTLSALDSTLGSVENSFTDDYAQLEVMRDIYFNRLTGKIDFKAYFELFRWFGDSIGQFIEQLIPRKTTFRGTNFVVESHMLERSRVPYRAFNQYIDESARDSIAASSTHVEIGSHVTRF